MKRFFQLVFVLIGTLIFLLPQPSYARTPEQITDWYIQDFQSEIKVNQDSSLLITEKITADCGNLPNKHGIFRILPTQIWKSAKEKIKTPIKLISITDFQDNRIPYETIKNRSEGTITWKIGDPNKTVRGVNYYKIIYQVQNAIRFDDANFDELYWNLNGNFWDLEIDSYSANLTFPAKVTSENSQIYTYAGQYGDTNDKLSTHSWVNNNVLNFIASRPLKTGEGITVSVTFPKNIFRPYQPGFWEKYGGYFFFLIPILIFILAYRLWAKYGDDPEINPTVVPEFDIPNNLPPMELGTVNSNGIFSNNFISAAIIDLAVKGAIKIEKIDKQGVFGKEDYKLTRLSKPSSELAASEKVLLEKLFFSQTEVLLSEKKNKFYTHIPVISSAVIDPLKQAKLVQPGSYSTMAGFIVIGVIALILGIVLNSYGWQILVSLALTGIIIIFFGALMSQRTIEGAKLFKKIQGFKLYMETAEKYRQQFNEKENIFEKLLPYAMIFGITSLWMEKMKIIYGENYFTTYHPVWFIGPGLATFNADTLNSAISGLSSNMSSTLSSSPSSSGSGGGGFSGGGGGGGGGGGW